jgi:phage baseplate assembly protein W
MPTDLGILKRLDKPRLSGQIIKSTGSTSYTWEAYEGDIQVDARNQLIPVDGTTKLAQGIFKIVLTPKGSNIEDPEYGTIMADSIGGKLDSEKFAVMQSSIIDALIHYNLINQDNPNSDEVIETIDLIRVVADPDDPRALKNQIAVTSESGKAVKIEVPQVI